MLPDHTGAEAQCLLVTGVGTATHIDAHIGLHPDTLRLHIQRGTKGSRTVRAGTYTALDLHRLHTRGEVTHVHPEHGGALGIVHGNTVRRDIHA